MTLNNFQAEILKHIGKRDGQMSWYQLDRLLAYDEFLPIIHTLVKVLRELEQKGLIRAEGETAQPIYFLTKAGTESLQRLLDKPPSQIAA